MSTVSQSSSIEGDIQQGNRCLLYAMGQHYMVEILEVKGRKLRVTFPARDYPVAGMGVELQFHDEEGATCYPSRVMEGPGPKGKGLVLEHPTEAKRKRHRKSCRVSTDLTAQVRDQVHLRRYDAALLNLSAAGALLETDATFDFDTTVELNLSLPGEPTHKILGTVVHLSEKPKQGRTRGYYYGLRFIGLERGVTRSLTNYIWKRLAELYPES